MTRMEFAKANWGKLLIAFIFLAPPITMGLYFFTIFIMKNPVAILYIIWCIAYVITMKNLFDGKFSRK